MVRSPADKTVHARAATASADVRAVLDAFRRIVQALRVDGRHGGRDARLTTAQLFALQQIADHPHASINDLAALTFTHQSSVSVVVQRLVRRRLTDRRPCRPAPTRRYRPGTASPAVIAVAAA